MVLASLLYGAAFPPLRWRILGWVALAPLFLALGRSTPRQALLVGLGWSVGAAYSVGTWMPGAVETYYQQAAWVGWAFFFGCALTMVAPYHTLAAWWIARLARGVEAGRLPAWSGPLLVAATWSAAELARGRLLNGLSFWSGNPWALLGYSQVGWPAVVQVASVTGVYGISFALAAAAAGGAELCGALLARRRPRPDVLVAAAAPGLLTLGFGALVVAAEEPPPEEGLVWVAAIQGNLEIGARWQSDAYGENFETYLDLTRAALARAPVELVLWPESAMTFFLEEEPAYRAALGQALAPRGATLLAGGPRKGPAADGDAGAPRYHNAIFEIGPDGRVRGHTDKEVLVPFSEHFPLRSIGLLRRRFDRVRSFTPAEDPRALATPLGPAAVAICNEAMLPEVVARRAEGAAWLLSPSNDTWIPHPRFAELQLDLVSLRAVEQRRWLVRASTSGPSALVDPLGRIAGRTGLLERRVLIGPVAARQGRTLYGRLGDAFALACGAAAGAAGLVAGRRSSP